MTQTPVEKLVFIDEAGANLSMNRSHAYVFKGEEYIERTPMNRGENLTMMGAIRATGWVAMNTIFKSTNGDRFVDWMQKKVMPKLKEGDVVILDNLSAHKDPRLSVLAEQFKVTIVYLPPYSPDFNPIEYTWAMVKRYIKTFAPRNRDSLLQIVKEAKKTITPTQCLRWILHAGYSNQSK